MVLPRASINVADDEILEEIALARERGELSAHSPPPSSDPR